MQKRKSNKEKTERYSIIINSGVSIAVTEREKREKTRGIK